MNDGIQLNDQAGVLLRIPTSPEAVVAQFQGSCKAVGKDPEGRILWEAGFDNLITLEGRNNLLNVILRGTAAPTFYLGLVTDNGTPTFSANDTLNSHVGWTEFTGYEDDRKLWGQSAADGIATNSSAVQFVTTENLAAVRGAFVCTSVSNTGWLLSVGEFAEGAKTLGAIGSTIDLTYTIKSPTLTN